jgi:hypothetical protein
MYVNSVRYKKARNEFPEFESCTLISASTLDEVANKNACSSYVKIYVKSRVVTVQWSRSFCRAGSYYLTLDQEMHFNTGTVRVTIVSIQAIC